MSVSISKHRQEHRALHQSTKGRPEAATPPASGTNRSSRGIQARAKVDEVSEIGGEGGIRSLPAPLESVTYGFHVAEDAVNAVPAVAPCT